MEQTEYFAQIRDAPEVRKALLSTSRDIIQILQRVERMKQLRTKKLEKIGAVRNTNKEIRLLVGRLKKAFPAAGMRVPTNPERKPEGRKIRGGELKELEEELKKIEGKIAQLS
jgi:hypothetical protein